MLLAAGRVRRKAPPPTSPFLWMVQVCPSSARESEGHGTEALPTSELLTAMSRRPAGQIHRSCGRSRPVADIRFIRSTRQSGLSRPRAAAKPSGDRAPHEQIDLLRDEPSNEVVQIQTERLKPPRGPLSYRAAALTRGFAYGNRSTVNSFVVEVSRRVEQFTGNACHAHDESCNFCRTWTHRPR